METITWEDWIEEVEQFERLIPNGIIEGEEILVPLFEIAQNPTIKLSEIKARRFYIVDRAKI